MGELLDAFFKTTAKADMLNPGVHYLNAALCARARRVAAQSIVAVRACVCVCVCVRAYSRYVALCVEVVLVWFCQR